MDTDYEDDESDIKDFRFDTFEPYIMDHSRDIDGHLFNNYIIDSVNATAYKSTLSWSHPSYGTVYRYNGLGEPVEEEKKKEPTLKVYNKRREMSLDQEYVVVCNEEEDLVENSILRNLSIMKTRFMMECLPKRIENIECIMTQSVKNNIVRAWKRLTMYGKKAPFVASFDEYGRKITDEIRIETMKGMTIKIIGPEEHGEFYLEFRGIVHDEDPELPF